ncbi:MAG: hypothetical protein Q9196_000650 [Gyalolechia fulgens]
MGRVKTPQVSVLYRDDDAASTSSAVPLQDHAYADVENPPAYTDDPNSVKSHPGIESDGAYVSTQAPGRESILLEPKIHEDSKGSITTYISKGLCADPESCQWFAQWQAGRAPKPMVRVVGSHVETRKRDKKEEKERVTDFDIKAPLHALLEPTWVSSKTVENVQKTYRGGIVKRVDPRMKAHPEAAATAPSLKEWCHRFCASSAGAKSFTISRKVTGIDHSILTQQMTEIIRSTNYRGHISITYPVGSRATVIMSDHWINRYRHNKFIWWACVILQLWILTWPLLWFMTKRWEVFSVEWPCRIYRSPDNTWLVSYETEPDRAYEGQPPEDPNVRPAHMSELDWVNQWTLAVQLAAESKKRGILTDTDRETAAAIEERSRQRRADSSITIPDNGFLAAASGLLGGVRDIMGQSQTLRGWGGDC